MSDYKIITSDFINLSITNSGHQNSCVERRFQKGITIDEFKVLYILMNKNYLLYFFA